MSYCELRVADRIVKKGTSKVTDHSARRVIVEDYTGNPYKPLLQVGLSGLDYRCDLQVSSCQLCKISCLAVQLDTTMRSKN